MEQLSDRARLIIIIITFSFAVLSMIVVLFVEVIEDNMIESDLNKISALKKKNFEIKNESETSDKYEVNKVLADLNEKYNKDKNLDDENKTDNDITNDNNLKKNINYVRVKSYDNNENTKNCQAKLLNEILNEDTCKKVDACKKTRLEEYNATAYRQDKNPENKSLKPIKEDMRKNKYDTDDASINEHFEDLADKVKSKRIENPCKTALPITTVNTPYIIHLGTYYVKDDALRVYNIAENKGINAYIYRTFDGKYSVECTEKYKLKSAKALESYFLKLDIEASIRAE